MQEGLLQFTIQDKLYTVPNDIPPDTTLNEYIRNYTHFKGTKFMCLEGGCGSCIVAIKRLDPVSGKQELLAVNSCLVPIFSCYGWSIITVEGTGNSKTGFSAIQSNLATASGTQCGYCSPGMVMNMFGLLNGNKEGVTMSEVENGFAGNICRCTGYRPILDAFKSMASDAPKPPKQKFVDIEDLMTKMKICLRTERECNNLCGDFESNSCRFRIPDVSFSMASVSGNAKWFRVKTTSEIFQIFELDTVKNYMILAGNTAHGAYRVTQPIDTYIDVNSVKELQSYSITNDLVMVGANMTLNKAIDLFNKIASSNPDGFGYLKQVAYHISLVANISVRNIGTLAGNLSTKYAHKEFPSDIFLLFEAVNAQLTVRHISGISNIYSPQQYLGQNMNKKLIMNIILPAIDSSSYVFNSYKIMQRYRGTHAQVNAAFLFKVDKTNNYKVLETPTLVYGGISSNFVHATKTEQYLTGQNLLDNGVLQNACKSLQLEVQPVPDPTESSPQYRQALAVNLFYKFVLNLSPSSISNKNRSGGSILTRPLSSGQQDFQTDSSLWPDTQPMPKLEAFLQCSGEAEYTYDIPNITNEVYGALVISKAGPGTITNVDTSQAEAMEGFVKFVTVKDIPGTNICSVGTSLSPSDPEMLFADQTVDYAGQIVGVAVAKTQTIANSAADRIVVNVKQTAKPILYEKDVVESGDKSRIKLIIQKAATSKKNNVKYQFEGTFNLQGQYHFTMENQTCLCVPTEDGIDIYPSTQWTTAVQQNVSALLNIPFNSINLRVRRIGGAYGVKLGRSILVAGACAVAANAVKLPVRMILKLETQMEAIGKRWPIYLKYNVATDDKGVVQFLNIDRYTNQGAHMNDTNNQDFVNTVSAFYDSQTWSINCYGVRTDVTAFTFCRAPNTTEAVAVTEHIMENIAKVLKLDPLDVRMVNLNPQFSYIPVMISDIRKVSDYDARKQSILVFNQENRWKKKGLSITGMNYVYAVLVSYHVILSVYAFDGTVSLTHGGIESGQGINTKAAQICAYTLGIDLNLIKVKPTNTMTAPNDGATGGSNATDGVSYATIQCCQILLDRLAPIKKSSPAGSSWQQIILNAYLAGVDLLCEYNYTPVINPIEYNIFGVTVAEVEVDLLTGQHQVLRVDLLEDVGQSINPLIDLGQIEGAYIMGLGYWLLEKLVYDENTGALLTNRTWTYTPPTAQDIPVDFRVYFRRNAKNPFGVLNSKATGEPATTMAVGLVFAIRNAIESGRLDAGAPDKWFDINVPYVPENVYLSSLTSYNQFTL